MIIGDSKRFKQVLFNLIGNAIKFTFHGTISLDLDYCWKQQLLTCKVADTGIGIKSEDQK